MAEYGLCPLALPGMRPGGRGLFQRLFGASGQEDGGQFHPRSYYLITFGRLLKAVEDLLGEITVLPFEVPADTEYGEIRAKLEAAGKPIGGNDLLIAAHAYATGATIVTANTDEFKRIRDLNVENWLA